MGAPDGRVVRRHGGLERVAHAVFDQFSPGQIRPARTHRADRPQRFTLHTQLFVSRSFLIIPDDVKLLAYNSRQR